jgi:lysyl-tRNA synthetase class 2
MRKIIIDKEIFEKFPGFNRGIIVISNLENKAENAEIEKMMNEQVEKRTGEDCVNHEFVKAWDTVYQELGINPNKFPPSIKSLLKRVSKGGKIPFINSVVALFNYVSLKHFLPCGGDDVETIEGNLKLSVAKGDEKFTSLGSTELENPEPGEVIYFDDATGNVMCRRWNWRNGDFSKITTDTKKVVINIDGIDPADKAAVLEARDELASLLEKHCNAKTETDLLNSEKPEMEINF